MQDCFDLNPLIQVSYSIYVNSFHVICYSSNRSYVINLLLLIAVLRERQTRDLESARVRCEKVDLNTKQKSEREKKIRDTVVLIPCNEAERNPKRLLSNTKASKSNSLTYEDLDEADRRRKMVGAHDSNVALTGRDLVFSGRAVPIWIKNAR